MATTVRILGLPQTEASLLAAILSQHGFTVIQQGRRSGRAAVVNDAVIEAANILTPQQIRVLRAVWRHRGTRAAAKALWLSHRTVERHLEDIRERLSVRGQAESVCWACRRGLLEPKAPSG